MKSELKMGKLNPANWAYLVFGYLFGYLLALLTYKSDDVSS